jgi:hypothetical protein
MDPSNPLDKMIPNHKNMSREEIGKEIGKYMKKLSNDPEQIRRDNERVQNDSAKVLSSFTGK